MGRAALALLCGILVVGAGPAAAQGSPGPGDGAIHGVVTDRATDSAVAGAHILLVGTPLAAAANERGEFRIVGLDPGTYAVRVLSIGYAPALKTNLVVGPGATVEVAVALERVALQLPGIVVTATGAAQGAGESAVSVSVQEHDEIVRRNAIEVQDALPFVPGVVMNHGQLDIRGATGNAGGVGSRVLMLLDGHPVLTGDGGEIDFEVLPMMDLDRAEVVKGAHSALYGSAAMGGVVNLITSPIDERPGTDVKLHYGAYDLPKAFRFGSSRLDYGGLDLQHSRQVGSAGVRLAFGRETSDGYQQNGNFSRWLFRSKLASMPGSPHPWDAYAVLSAIDAGQFFVWRSADQPYQVDSQAIGDWNHVVNVLAGGRYVAVSGSSAMLQVEPSVTHTEVRDHMHDSRNWHRATRAGVNAQLAFNPGSEHAVIVGVDVAGTTVNSSYYGKKWVSDAAPFAQEEFTFTPLLKGTAGLRLDYHHVDGGLAEQTVNPKVAVVYTPAAPFALRASFGRGYRAPSAIEQFVSTVQSGFRVIPNPSLHGETAWSGEMGGTASLGRLWLDGALFQARYHGLIGPAGAPGQLGAFSFQNLQRARVRGVDAAAKLGVVPRMVDLSVNYLFLDTRDLDTGLPLPYRSRHSVTSSVEVLGGAAGVDVRYRSRIEQVLAYPLDPRSDVVLVDLRGGLRIAKATVLVRVSNLLQRKYVDVMERNQGTPRSILVTGMATF